MLKRNQILNFNVYDKLEKLLKGKNFAFSLNQKAVKKIKNKKAIRVITLTGPAKIDGKILAHFPNLRLLISRSVGVDHVNLVDCKKHGIKFFNIPDYGSFFVAEHIFALLLSLTRKTISLNQETRRGKFDYQKGKGFTLEGKVFGAIGTGRIGLEAIKLAKAFKMGVLAFDVDKKPNMAKKVGFKYVSFDKLLKQADVISLHVPLNKKTYYLIDGPEIKKMKKGVILINTSRGAVVNTKALVKNIKKFRYVALDVLEDEEQFSKNHPLLKFKNVLITPHCAFYTDKTVERIAEKTKKIIEGFV